MLFRSEKTKNYLSAHQHYERSTLLIKADEWKKLNKAFNDSVHVARAFSGLDRIADIKGVNLPRGGILRIARRAFNVVPIHRLFHSVEFTMYIAIFWQFGISLQIALIFAVIVTIGHVLAIISSAKLRNSGSQI